MIRIITDTASDITQTQAGALDIGLVPLDIHFGEGPYDVLADESFETFYQMLDACKELPTTSQPAPELFLEHYQQAKAAGDEVLVITLSSGLSGTYQSALIAKEMAEYDRIEVIDSLTAITGQRLLVDLAISLRQAGRPFSEVVAEVSEAVNHVVLLGGLTTLKNLRKGGRIPKSAEMLGKLIGIKPLIEVIDGKIEMTGKARGRKGAIDGCLAQVAAKSDFDLRVPVYFSYTQAPQQCEAIKAACMEAYGFENTVTYPIGSVIGTHVGPGAFCIVYLRKGVNTNKQGAAKA